MCGGRVGEVGEEGARNIGWMRSAVWYRRGWAALFVVIDLLPEPWLGLRPRSSDQRPKREAVG